MIRRSLDARSKGQSGYSPMGVDGVKGETRGLLVSCARATRGLRRPSLDARTLRPCSPLLQLERGSLEGRSACLVIRRGA
jgi:hypothetical protein